jgi:hypothetical protein
MKSYGCNADSVKRIRDSARPAPPIWQTISPLAESINHAIHSPPGLFNATRDD